MTRKKYRFRDRMAAETRVQELEQTVTMHEIALDAILRNEFTFTRRFEGDGSWFEMGIARVSACHGGLVLLREYYPVNGKPSQDVRWADGWVRQMSEGFCMTRPANEGAEAQAYRDCFYALRELYNAAMAAA